MGKETGFLEIERQDRGYADPKERVQHYREFIVRTARTACATRPRGA
jgi:glutamate synthase (NADPH/NADH) small chain